MQPVRTQLLAIGLAFVVAGCAGLGEDAGRISLPAGAPKPDEILRDLARNDARIQSFRAGGTFVIASPEFEAIKQFRGSIRFRRPSDLYVQGNQQLTNIPVFKLACVGTEFIMEFPNSRDQSFYQVEGEVFEDVPFSVSPSDVAREMFLPEDWGALAVRDARVIAFDPETQAATLSVGAGERPRRVVELVRVNDAEPSWVAKKNTRLSDSGEVLAVTTLDQYKNVDGALFPTAIAAIFPTEETRMTFTMRNVRLNEAVADKYFNIRERARELNLTQRRASRAR